MKTPLADRIGPPLTFVFVLLVFVLGAVLDSQAAPVLAETQAAPFETALPFDTPARLTEEAVLAQRVHTYGMADVCGEHPDVAPTTQLGTYRALLAVLRAEPRLIHEACQVWRSYRAI